MDFLWFSQEQRRIYKLCVCVCGQLSWSLLILLHAVPAPSKYRVPVSYLWMYGRENLLLSYCVGNQIRACRNWWYLLFNLHFLQISHEETMKQCENWTQTRKYGYFVIQYMAAKQCVSAKIIYFVIWISIISLFYGRNASRTRLLKKVGKHCCSILVLLEHHNNLEYKYLLFEYISPNYTAL